MKDKFLPSKNEMPMVVFVLASIFSAIYFVVA